MGLFDIFRKNKNASTLPSGPETKKDVTQPLQDGLAQYKVNYDMETTSVTPRINPRKISGLDFYTWI